MHIIRSTNFWKSESAKQSEIISQVNRISQESGKIVPYAENRQDVSMLKNVISGADIRYQNQDKLKITSLAMIIPNYWTEIDRIHYQI